MRLIWQTLQLKYTLIGRDYSVINIFHTGKWLRSKWSFSKFLYLLVFRDFQRLSFNLLLYNIKIGVKIMMYVCVIRNSFFINKICKMPSMVNFKSTYHRTILVYKYHICKILLISCFKPTLLLVLKVVFSVFYEKSYFELQSLYFSLQKQYIRWCCRNFKHLLFMYHFKKYQSY